MTALKANSHTEVVLTLIKAPPVPAEMESITPENLAGKEQAQIEDLTFWVGRKEARVGDYFQVEINQADRLTAGDKGRLPRLRLVGDLSRCKRIGWEMAAGEIRVQGSVGFHAGAFMRGGTLEIFGNAGDWLGAHMQGGKIVVQGNAGHFVGAAYRGYTAGMRGGAILIRGSAGQMVGARMRRGLIAVGGDSGDFPGLGMLAGTVVVFGSAGVRAGALMRRGTIMLFQPAEPLPSFRYDCTYLPPFWPLLVNYLRAETQALGDFPLPVQGQKLQFKRYSGDMNELGKGEILVCQA